MKKNTKRQTQTSSNLNGDDTQAIRIDQTDGHETSDGVPNLAEIATSINNEHQGVLQMIRRGLTHARSAGKLLIHAKSLFKHGEWTEWMKSNLQCSVRTAQTYMQIAEKWDELTAICEADAQDVADLGLQQALTLVSSPKPQAPTELQEPQADEHSEPNPRSTRGTRPTKTGVNRTSKGEEQPELKSAPTPLQPEATSPCDVGDFVDRLAGSVRKLKTLVVPSGQIPGEHETRMLKLIDDGISAFTRIKRSITSELADASATFQVESRAFTVRTTDQLLAIQDELEDYLDHEIIGEIIDELQPETATYLREWGDTAVTVGDRLANVEDDLAQGGDEDE